MAQNKKLRQEKLRQELALKQKAGLFFSSAFQIPGTQHIWQNIIRNPNASPQQVADAFHTFLCHANVCAAATPKTEAFWSALGSLLGKTPQELAKVHLLNKKEGDKFYRELISGLNQKILQDKQWFNSVMQSFRQAAQQIARENPSAEDAINRGMEDFSETFRKSVEQKARSVMFSGKGAEYVGYMLNELLVMAIKFMMASNNPEMANELFPPKTKARSQTGNDADIAAAQQAAMMRRPPPPSR